MLQPRIAPSFRRAIASKPLAACLYCQKRAPPPPFSIRQPVQTFSSAQPLRLPPAPTPKSTGTNDDEETFVPKPLGRPIGFKKPPRPGEYTGAQSQKKDYSNMTMSERNLAKRAEILEKWGTNYFRDFKNIRKYRSGKTFMANKSIFRKEVSLYFPNFRGQTPVEAEADTTNVLKGKISVVNVYSSAWGEGQTRTFTSKQRNPRLAELLKQNPELTQLVEINIEENPVKAWIVKMFLYKQRAVWPKEDWGKYFVVRDGVDQRIRETIGLLNGRVGYVYLLDQDCKIRWAGSAVAEGTEAEDLTRGFQRLILEASKSPGPGHSDVKGAPRTKDEESNSAAREPIPV